MNLRVQVTGAALGPAGGGGRTCLRRVDTRRLLGCDGLTGEELAGCLMELGIGIHCLRTLLDGRIKKKTRETTIVHERHKRTS